MAGIKPGAVLETVLLGGLVDGVLRIWRGDGRPESRRVAAPRPLAESLGRGVLARTSPEAHRFREVALLNETSSTLVLVERADRGRRGRGEGRRPRDGHRALRRARRHR